MRNYWLMVKFGKKSMLLLAIISLVSCKAPEKVLYLQDLTQPIEQALEMVEEVKVQKDDLLQIYIFAQNAEAAKPFNMMAMVSDMGTSSSNPEQTAYLVDAKGCIDLPVLGRMVVEGMTTQQIKEHITRELVTRNLIKEPVVQVRIQNFKISVLGEVKNPGVVDVKGERITVLEVLSKAGDLTIQGRRDHVAVIREVDGKRTVNYLDLKSKEIFDSPYYYLKQNDVVYVEPNDARTVQYRNNQVNNVGTWLSVLSSMLSVVTLIVTLK